VRPRPAVLRPAARARPSRPLAAAALIAAAAGAAPAQQPAAPAGAPAAAAPAVAAPPPVLRASRLEGSVRLDGRLDEPAWAAAAAAGDFVQQWPKDRAPASQRTEARILYDGQALYVGVRAFDARPDSIAAQLARRDATNIYSDWVHVVLDSYHDRRTGFRFSVNPKGVQKDVRHFDDGNEDLLWDAVWEVATAVDSLGWTAEYRIPLSQLRYAARAKDSTAAGGARPWGLQVSRDIARYQERDNWAPIPQNANGYVSRFGDLAGLDRLASPSRLEVVPYASNRLSRVPGDAANPFYRRTDVRPSVGGDFRYGVTSGLTLTGTVNPDFGQVELDPAFVNLGAFEVFLPERRPFFIEGGEIFNFGRLAANNTAGGGQLFYSRRIGRAPQRSAYSADQFGRNPVYADAPTQTSIVGAAKLSGKTANGWSVGILDAVTSAEEARLLQRISLPGAAPGAAPVEVRRSTPVEPRSNYLVARTRKDFRGGRTVLGGVLTNVVRDLSARDRPYDAGAGRMVEGGEIFRPILARTASVGGIDFEHNWHQRDYVLTGFVTGTRVSGSRQTITALQRANYRLYQRPDGGPGVDTAATTLGGYETAVAVAKQGGQHWTGSLAYQEYSRGFELNDLGFGTTTDQRSLSWIGFYRENKPTGRMARFRNYGTYLFGNHVYSLDGISTFQGYGLGTYAQEAKSLWNYEMTLRYSPAAYDIRLLRGGPTARRPAEWRVNPFVGTDSRKPVVLALGGTWRQTDIGGWERGVTPSLSLRPTTSLRVALDPSLTSYRIPTQYVQRVADPLAAATYGARYVFADVDQTTASVTARVNWTFTPRLTLETVMQPFVSAVRFRDYKEFTTPRTLDFAVYGRDAGSTIAPSDGGFAVDPDGAGAAPAFRIPDRSFTDHSLRGSAVLRWEYRPGSALFVVWQQQRAGTVGDGRFDAGRDLGALFRDPARNVFLVKATYWLSR
jgi:hypothetical protein